MLLQRVPCLCLDKGAGVGRGGGGTEQTEGGTRAEEAWPGRSSRGALEDAGIGDAQGWRWGCGEQGAGELGRVVAETAREA